MQQLKMGRWLVWFYFFINSFTSFAVPSKSGLMEEGTSSLLIGLNNFPVENENILFSMRGLSSEEKYGFKKDKYGQPLVDSLPKTIKNLVVIPFEYKQSALYHPFTFKAIDSVINILLGNDSITLSIDGYAHVDEGIDSICYYLSLNRALVIRDYVLGRGVDSSRILSLRGFGNVRSANRKANNQSVEFNCRTEITLNYPIPPPKLLIADKDEDGIVDSEDKCPDEYGEKVNNGCPNKDAIIVPFEIQQSSLYSMTYRVLDSVVNILLEDPSVNISIEGYACKKEGVESLCERLARERADITKRYLLTRHISASRIINVSGFGVLHPLNACRNPQEIARNIRSEIYLIRP